MTKLLAPTLDQLEAATELCMRSKAHWGYDADFMSACKSELTLTSKDLAETEIVLAISGETLAGVAQVSNSKDGCYLEKLFIAPEFMGQGIGRRLFQWSRSAAAELGAREMIVEADPDAVAFYLAMRCRRDGTAPSGSVPGRVLPRLVCDTVK